jgi:uncharacterized repeat protein (TIGR01451 family)
MNIIKMTQASAFSIRDSKARQAASFWRGALGVLALMVLAPLALAADLSVSSYNWTPDPVVHGGNSTFTVEVTNNDTAVTVSSLTLVVQLPANVDFSTSAAPTNCAFDLGVSPQLLTCTNATLLPQAVWTVVFNGKGLSAGVATTTASISAAGNADGNAGNDALTKNTTVINGANLTILKTGPSNATAGDVISFNLAVSNFDGPDPATTFRVIDNLPAATDFTYQSYSGSNWTCNNAGTTLTCDYSGPSIASGAAAPVIAVTGRIITSAGSITNGASVASTDSTTGDPVAGNNGPSLVVVSVAPGTALRANKTMVSVATGMTSYATGEAVSLTLSATNQGPQNATGVTLTDTVPADFTIGTLPSGCVAAGQAITCTVGALANGVTSSSFVIPLTVSGAAGNSGSNTANITRSGPAGGSNTPASVGYSIAAPFAHLTLVKTKGPNPVAAGGNITNTVTVTNSNSSTSTATGTIRVTDVLSVNETYVSAAGANWSCSASGSPETVTCDNSNPSNLARGASLPLLTITTQAASGYLGSITNTACTGQSAGSPHLPADNSSTGNCQSKTVTSTPRNVDLVMAKIASLATLDTATNTFSYTLTVSNGGPDVAPTAIVTDVLQAWYSGNAGTTTGSAIITGAAAGESCSFGSTVTCTLLDVTNGAPRTITLTLHRPIASGVIANTASVSTPDAIDSNGSNNSDSASITVDSIADVAVTGIAAAPNPVKVGVQLTYTTSIKNNGPSSAAGVVLRQVIDPARMTYVTSSAAISGTTATCNFVAFAGAPYAGQQGIECTGFSLSNGESRQLVFKVIPFYPYPDALDASYTSNANISTTTVESDAPGYANNSNSNTVTVTTKAIDLTVTDNDPGFDPTAFGDFINYQVVAQNNGPSQATGFMLTVTPTPPPQGSQAAPYTMTYNAAGSTLPAGANCSVVGSDVVCYLGANRAASVLAASDSKTFTLRFDTGPISNVPAGSITYKTTAAVESYETGASPFAGDTLAGNNSVQETTTVLPKTDLSVVSKTVSQPVVDLNQEFIYTLTVANAGPSDASGVQVTDALPSGLVRTGTAISVVPGSSVATLVTNSCSGPANGSGGTVTCNLGVLPSGGDSDVNKRVSINIPVRAAYQASGTYAFAFNSNIGNTANIAPLPNTSLDVNSGNNSGSVNVQVRKNSIAGYVYADNDLSNSMDASGAEGIGGVTLTLTGTDSYGYTYGAGMNFAALTATTSGTAGVNKGSFLFDKLPPGAWQIVETQPAGYWDRYETVGTAGGVAPAPTCDGTTNCAATDPANTISAITLPASANTAATGYVFQEYQTAQLSGYVYSDLNNDGQRAASGEPGLASLANQITLSGTAYNGLSVCALVTCTLSLDGNGKYNFANLPPDSGSGYTLTQNYQPTGYYDGKEQTGSGNVVVSSAGRQPFGTTGNSHTESLTGITLIPNQSRSEYDFGELPAASLAGSVFIDSNSNAAKDSGETGGVPSVIITLAGTDYLGNAVCPNATVPSCTFTTDGSGNYAITNLPPGVYSLTETPPAGLTHTGAQPGSAGGTGGAGSGVTAISGITLGAGVAATGYHFGEFGQVLSGYVYVDLNGNGSKDAGEPGIPGVTVTLSGQTAGAVNVCSAIFPNPCSVTTGADGSYNFVSLPASDASGYTLTEQSQASAPLSNYGDGAESVGTVNGVSKGASTVNDQLSGIVVGIGQSGTGYNFGELGGSLAGTVYVDVNNDGVPQAGESKLAGVTLTLSGTTTSGANVCTVIPGCVTTSNASGVYSFTGLPSGSFTLTETQPAAYGDGKEGVGSPAGTVSNTVGVNTVSAIPLGVHQTGAGYDFGELTGTLAGTVFNDLNANGVLDSGEPGIPGVTLTLTGADVLGNPVSLTTTTAADGSYSFSGLLTANGSGYTLTETQPTGWLDGQTSKGKMDAVACAACNNATANKVQTIPFQPDHSYTAFDFGEVHGTSIAGHVYADANTNSTMDGGEALASVTLTLTGNDDLGAAVNLTTTTAADGSYSFASLRPSSAAGYTVTETQPTGLGEFTGVTGTLVGSAGGSASLDITSAIVLGSGVAGTGYDFRENASSLTGSVYLDTNNNGSKDGGEAGIAGVTVTLSCVSGGCSNACTLTSCTMTTDANGSYSFVGLPSGTYSLVETHPTIYQDGQETAGGLGGNVDNSGFDTSAARNSITAIPVGTGQSGTGYLFGERAGLNATVSGKVWLNSVTHDAIQQAGEPGLAGWIVELVHGGSVVTSTTTAADGTYTLTGVTPNTGYELRFRNPANNDIYGNAVSTEPGVNLAAGMIQNLTVYSGANIVDQNLPIDPSGVVYNSITRSPVAGATVTLSGPGGFVPASHLVGGTAALTQITGADGYYQFLLMAGAPLGTYTLAVTTVPAGYLPSVSAIIPPTAGPLDPGAGPGTFAVQAQTTAPTGVQPTVYYLTFTLGVGKANVINNQIPIDPILAGAIRMTKTTPLLNVAKGDLVPYTITATNTLAATLANINVQDLIPPGFKYMIGSAKLDGVAAEPAIHARQLTWANQTFAPNAVKTVKLMLVVGAGVSEGEYTNQTWALNNIVNSLVSNTATATVRIVPDPTFDCSDIIGKVFDDRNANGYQDEGEPGIPNVRLATVNGLLVTTDKDGRFHVACADIPQAQRGSNFIMKLDERTLPSGYRVTTENPRDVRTTRGKLVKLNFGATIHRIVRLELTDAAFQPGKAEPAAALMQAIERLPQTLRVKPSVVRLAYRNGGEAEGLIADRLRGVRERLERLWKEQGCCYTLVFEEEIFARAAGKKGGAK